MAAITAELALEVSKFQGALQQAQTSLQGFRARAQRQGDGLGKSMFGGLNRSAANVGEVMAGAIRGLKPAALLHRHFNDLGAVLGPAMAGAVAAVGVGKLVSGAISRAVSDEQMQVSFEVLVGNAAKAKETIASLRKLGAETPFEFPELADAGKKLIAFGEGADTVTDTLRRIGDISSGIQAPIGEIAEIYGKARVQGRLFAEDINQLTGRGIPVIQEFAKQLGVTDAEVKKMASDGKISFANLEQAFLSLTSEGGKFGGMMARQSRTVGGLWSTLKDTWGEVLLSFGQPVNDTLRPLLDESIGSVGSLRDNAAQIRTAVAGAGKKAGEFHTPQQISNVLSAIVALDSQEPMTGTKTRLESVLDFACGSGSLLRNVRHRMQDAIVANPRFSLRWEPTDALADAVRFTNHGLAPKSAADFAFLLHGFHHLKDEGVMAIILPHGVLFRSGAEERIRTKLLKDGHIDTYRNRTDEERYARRVTMDEMEGNEFNLNISRYISTAVNEEEVDLAAAQAWLVELDQQITEARDRHNHFLKELGLPLLPGTMPASGTGRNRQVVDGSRSVELGGTP
jgi:tape measure domain-containing protein